MTDSPTLRIAPDVKLGRDVKIYAFVNLYGCEIGDESKIGTFVEIQKGARIGRRVKVSSHTFICEGVTIEDEAFIGHGVMFINDKYPRSTTSAGSLQTEADWVVTPTIVKKHAAIGSNATILCGVTIGEGAMVGAGSVVTQNVPAGAVVAGNPARPLPSAVSRDIFGNGEERQNWVVENRGDAPDKFGHGQGFIRFTDFAFCMNPHGFNWVEPGTLLRQQEGQ